MEPVKRGRPSNLTDEKLTALIGEISTSTKSLRKCCEGMNLRYQSVLEHLRGNSSFRAQYAQGKIIQADWLFEEMLDIADDCGSDTYKVGNKVKTNWETIGRAKLRIDTRKWIVTRLNPKKYGSDAIIAEFFQKEPGKVTDEQRAKIMALLNARARTQQI